VLGLLWLPGKQKKEEKMDTRRRKEMQIRL
jgi:hypothetical protein